MNNTSVIAVMMSYPVRYTMRFEEQFWETETKVSIIVETETSIFRTFDLETLVQIPPNARFTIGEIVSCSRSRCHIPRELKVDHISCNFSVTEYQAVAFLTEFANSSDTIWCEW